MSASDITSIPQANEATYRLLLDLIANQRYDRWGEVFSPGAVLHTLPNPTPAGIAEMNAPFFAAFPDVSVEVVNLVANDSYVAGNLLWSGTHTGDLFGLEPTGKPIAITEIETVRMEDGRIVELWNVFDLPALWEQLGVEPPA
ncbi:MAG TPA: ester cyclase [Acidimicrobiales bacterium]|jgi:predicted ester cyclase|nr:ester cyclase [Acidimicrobiales bacterium]